MKINTYLLWSILLLLLLLFTGCGKVKIEGDVLAPGAVFAAPACTNDAKLITAESSKPASCGAGFADAGGFGVSVEKRGSKAWSTCKTPVLPWLADPAKTPYADLYMTFTKKGGLSKAEPCASSYEELGTFDKKFDDSFNVGGRLCGKRGKFPYSDLMAAAAAANPTATTTPTTPTGGVIATPPQPQSPNSTHAISADKITGRSITTSLPHLDNTPPHTPIINVNPCESDLHCENGKQDCNEQGVDCDGGCDPCKTTAPPLPPITTPPPITGRVNDNSPQCQNSSHCSNGKLDCGEETTDCGDRNPDTGTKGECDFCTGNRCKQPGEGHCTNGIIDCDEEGKMECNGVQMECGGADCLPCGGECTMLGNDTTALGDINLPLVEDFTYLSCAGCTEAPKCPDGYTERGSIYMKAKFSGSFWVKLAIGIGIAIAALFTGGAALGLLGVTGTITTAMAVTLVVAGGTAAGTYMHYQSQNTIETGHMFCVKYNLGCAAREPDQWKEMCEYTEGGAVSTTPPASTPLSSTTPSTTTGSGGFAVDGGPGVWVKTKPELTPPLPEGTPLPPLPPFVTVDGTADPFYFRIIKPDTGEVVEGATAEIFQKRRIGNCCLDGDECKQVCERTKGVWPDEAKTPPMYMGIKLFKNPMRTAGPHPCYPIAAKLGVEEGDATEGWCFNNLIDGPCCGDDTEVPNHWTPDQGGGDCLVTVDDANGKELRPDKWKNTYMCLTDASGGSPKWMNAAAAPGNNEEQIYRPMCYGQEFYATDEWTPTGKKYRLGCGSHRPMDHAKNVCFFNYNDNPGHDIQFGADTYFGGDQKASWDCADAGPYHRVAFCGATGNTEPNGGINYAVDELAAFFCGYTYCVSDNTFGKDLDPYPGECEQFPIIKIKNGQISPYWFDTVKTDQHLVWTGNYCCGEVDDDEPAIPFDGEFYNDRGGKGACFINYQPNGQYLQNTVHVGKDVNVPLNEQGDTAYAPSLYLGDAFQLDDGRFKADTNPTEEKGGFIYNGTILGCHLQGPYNQQNDYLIDIKDQPNWAHGRSIYDGGYHDPTQGNGPDVIQQQDYCTKTGPPEDITKLYCSYTEQWLERNGTARDVLKKIAWIPEETVISQQLTPSIGNATNGTLTPVRSDKQYYLTINQTNETTNTSTTTEQYLFLEQECCGQNQCWDGYRCLDDQSAKPAEPTDAYTLLKSGEGFRCINGEWKNALLKYTPDGSESGYCPESAQCLYDLEGNQTQNNLQNCDDNNCQPQCIRTGQYIKDDYCNNGTWTTRTRILAQVMLDKTRAEIDGKDYTLFCDKATATLNNIQNPGNTNNYCALIFEGKTILGTTYNGNRTALFDALKQSYIFSHDNIDANSTDIKNFGQNCKETDNLDECITLKDKDGKDLLHLYHQGTLKMIVMGAQTVPGLGTSNPFEILWNWLKDLFQKLLQTTQTPLELTDFKQLYLSNLPPQRINGIAEILYNANKSTNETKAFDNVVTIEYSGYTVDFTNLINSVTADMKLVNGTIGNQTILLINPGNGIWEQFTEKLRPKKVTS